MPAACVPFAFLGGPGVGRTGICASRISFSFPIGERSSRVYGPSSPSAACSWACTGPAVYPGDLWVRQMAAWALGPWVRMAVSSCLVRCGPLDAPL